MIYHHGFIQFLFLCSRLVFLKMHVFVRESKEKNRTNKIERFFLRVDYYDLQHLPFQSSGCSLMKLKARETRDSEYRNNIIFAHVKNQKIF